MAGFIFYKMRKFIIIYSNSQSYLARWCCRAEKRSDFFGYFRALEFFDGDMSVNVKFIVFKCKINKSSNKSNNNIYIKVICCKSASPVFITKTPTISRESLSHQNPNNKFLLSF